MHPAKVYFRFGMDGSSGYSGSTDSTSPAPSLSRNTVLISLSIWSEMAASFFACFTMNSRTTAMRMPFSGLFEASLTRKLAYGSFGMMPGVSAVNMSSVLKPFTASSTFTASVTVRQCTPARSPESE